MTQGEVDRDIEGNGSTVNVKRKARQALSVLGLARMNARLLKAAVRVWLVETLTSSFNFFVLMNLIYEPRWGALRAHQIGMSTRIVYIFIFAYFLLKYTKNYTTKDLVFVGILWLILEEVFEWGGSLLIGRSVEEILIGWNIFAGYMWPYVLLAYLLSNLIVGTVLHPGKGKMD